MRIVLLPTLEYELYHGRNFVGADEALFDPTARILNRADRCGIPFTLFADVCSVWAFRRHGLETFPARFERQLVDAVARGHDAQLHLHVHWLYSYFSKGEWRLHTPTITMSDLDFSTNDAGNIIERGVRYLEGLIRPRCPGYRCIAFRAGGLTVEPREHIMKALAHSGVLLDSSIAKDYRIGHDVLRIDYRGMPPAANWEVAHGVVEVPIVTFHMGVQRRLEFLIRRVKSWRSRRGSPISRVKRQTAFANASTLVQQNTRYLAADPVFLFSADTKGLTKKMLVQGFQQYVELHERLLNGTMYVSMINHPKLMFPREEDLLFDVLDELRTLYGSRLSFQTFGSVAAELNAQAV